MQEANGVGLKRLLGQVHLGKNLLTAYETLLVEK